MITLEYFDGNKWIEAGKFYNENSAWISLGSDNINYRTVDENGKVLTDKSDNCKDGYEVITGIEGAENLSRAIKNEAKKYT